MFMRFPLFTAMFLILSFSVQPSEAQWYRISGKYATVEYTEDLKTIADSLLKTAEWSIPRLCEMHGLSPEVFEDDPAKIILTDAPDISNGFAIGKSVVIYAVSSSYIPGWTGFITWYNQVLTHELAHHVTFRKINRKLGFLGEVTKLTVPRWFYEGIAQYFSESWNMYRGDLFVRNAVLYGKLTETALYDLRDGALLYGTAHAFTRYLADQYGDSSLIKLMSYDKDGLFYDFNDAFKDTYGKKVSRIFPEFVRHLVLYYGNKMIEYPVSKSLKPLPSVGHQPVQIIPLSSADSTYLILTQEDKNHRYLSAIITGMDNGTMQIKKRISNNVGTYLTVSPDHKYIAYARADLGIKDNIDALNFQWFVYDTENGKKQKAGRSRRCRYASFSAKNHLVMAEILADHTVFRVYDPETEQEGILFETRMPAGRFIMNSHSDLVFEAQQTDGNRDLFLYRDSAISPLTDDLTDDRNAFFLSDSVIIFNRYTRQQPMLSRFNLNTGTIKPLWEDQYEYWLHGKTDHNELIFRSLTPERKPAFSSIHIDSLEYTAVHPDTKPGYESWISKKPQPDLFTLPDTQIHIADPEAVRFPQLSMSHIMSIALPTFDENLGWGIYGLSAWFEPLQRQTFAGTFLLFPEQLDQSFAVLSHSLRIADMDIFSNYYHGPVIFAFNDAEYQEIVRDYGSIGLSRKRFIGGNPRLPYRLSLYYALDRLDPEDESRSILYHGPEWSVNWEYRLPSLYFPAVPKRHISLAANIFKSIAADHDFTIYQATSRLGSQLFLEEFGISTALSYVHAAGDLPGLQAVGIDRYYQYNVPRDLRYTRTVRGVGTDLYGETLYWSSTELSYFLSGSTPFTLLFLPVRNVALSAFMDAARVEGPYKSGSDGIDATGYGIELSFGEDGLRFAGGFARSKIEGSRESDKAYLRISLYLPAF